MDLSAWLRSVAGLEPRRDAAPRWPSADQIIDGGRPTLQRYDGGSSVLNAITGLGGSADKGATARPNPCVVPLDLNELRTLYRFNGLARRLVNLRAERACRRGWTVPEMGAEDQRLQIHARVEEAMRWADLYGGAVLVPITIDDVPPAYQREPARWLTQPLDPLRVGRVVALHVFDALEAVPLRWDRDPSSPTFRLPASWRISSPGFQVEVHASRVIHVRGARRPPSEMQWSTVSTLPDDPYLQAIWDEIRRVTETMQGGATLAQELRGAVLTLAGLAERATGDEGAAVFEQIELMKYGDGLLGVKIIGPGDKFESYSNAPTGFSDLSEGAWTALSAATQIPRIVLTGDAPGGLSTDGESGHESLRQLISTYQEQRRPEIEQLYQILYAAQDGPTRGEIPDPAERALVFAPLDEPSETVKADIRLKVAQADQINVASGIYTPADVARARFGAEGWAFELDPVTPPDAEHQGLGAELRGRGGLAAIPGLISAGVLTEATAAKLLGLPPPPDPDPAEEAAIAAAAAHLAGTATGAPPGEGDPAAATPPAGSTRTAKDAADDSVWVGIPAPDLGLRAAVERAIGQTLTVEDDPHVTVLYLGTGLDAEAVAEVLEEVGEAVEAMDAAALLASPVVRAFPPGPYGVPIVVEWVDTWTVQRLNDTLLRALAHVTTARQFPTFRAHTTIGYAPEPLSPEAQAALVAIPIDPALRIPVGSVEVRQGDRVLLVAYPGAEAAQNEPNVPAEEEPA